SANFVCTSRLAPSLAAQQQVEDNCHNAEHRRQAHGGQEYTPPAPRAPLRSERLQLARALVDLSGQVCRPLACLALEFQRIPARWIGWWKGWWNHAMPPNCWDLVRLDNRAPRDRFPVSHLPCAGSQ